MRKSINARACRFKELRLSLELYGINPDLKLHPPRAQRPASQRTFASSNYKSLIRAANANTDKMSSWLVVRAVEELIKIHAPDNWASSFWRELKQSKKHEDVSQDDVGATAQYLCKCTCPANLAIGVHFAPVH